MFLLYSNYENLPCVIAESLVSGLPVLSSKAGGTAEMVDATSGIIVEAKNNTLLIKQLNYMLDNIEQYNTTEIAEKAVQKYSYENVGKQFLSIYQKVLNR